MALSTPRRHFTTFKPWFTGYKVYYLLLTTCNIVERNERVNPTHFTIITSLKLSCFYQFITEMALFVNRCYSEIATNLRTLSLYDLFIMFSHLAFQTHFPLNFIYNRLPRWKWRMMVPERWLKSWMDRSRIKQMQNQNSRWKQLQKLDRNEWKICSDSKRMIYEMEALMQQWDKIKRKHT